jgi:hypothetical protein
VPSPDLVLAGPPQLISALFTGQVSVAEVTARGLRMTGDTSLLDRVLPGEDDAYRTSRQPDLSGGKR